MFLKFTLSVLILVFILLLSAFTHLWNPIGFPSVHVDEGHYMRRSINVMEGFGPQDGAGPQYAGLYDHPYFGQMFLGTLFNIIGYPSSLGLIPGEHSSTENLFLVPRILMGILAVVDTFLIYKIGQYRYNRTVGFIASFLFAVVPYTLSTRGILLEPIQLPFILTSILLAIYIRDKVESSRVTALIIMSGVFLGLAIFTKIPAFTMIPLIGFLVYSNAQDNKIKRLAIWFIPVLLIPLIWPIFAIAIGDLNDWIDGVLWQTDRVPRPLESALHHFFMTNTIILLLGMIGVIIAVLKKDLFPLLGSLPFFIFLYLINYVSPFHFIPVFPILCLASSIAIVEASKKAIWLVMVFKSKAVDKLTGSPTKRNPEGKDWNRQNKYNLAFYLILLLGALIIGVYALLNTIDEITSNNTTTYFQILTFLVKILDENYNDNESGKGISVISSSRYLWVPDYIFDIDKPVYASHLATKTLNNLNKSQDFIIIVDQSFRDSMAKGDVRAKILQTLYNSSIPIEKFTEDADLNELWMNNDRAMSKVIEIRTNSHTLLNNMG